MPACSSSRPLSAALSAVVLRLMLPLVLAGLLALPVGLVTPPADAGVRSKIDRAVRIALNQVGDPYRYGAEGPDRFDCSGLIFYSYRRAGFVNMPRTSGSQARWLGKVRKRNMRRGDLMFFADGGGIYHAGIFLRWENGRALMLDAGSSGGHVRRRHPWTRAWFGRTARWH